MIQYEFDPVRSVAHITVSEELTDAELLSWVQEFLDAIRNREGLNGILDTCELIDLNVMADTVREVTRLVAAREEVFAGSYWAFVANRDSCSAWRGCTS